MNTYRIQSYEDIRDSLRVRLMDIKRNPETLQNSVYEPVGCGLALVAYMELVLSRAGFTAMGSWQFYVLHLLFLLPCALLMTPAGYFSDKFPKERVLRWTTLLSLPTVVLFSYGVCTANLLCEFLAIGLFFVLQAFQSPAKNGYMKELVGVRSLAQGSGILMIILFVALVLSGGVTAYAYQRMLPVAGDLSEALQIFAPVGITLVALEILGILFTFGLPPIGAYDAELKFPWKRYWNLLFTRRKLSKLWVNRALRQSIIGLSMFWVIIFLMVFIIQDLFGSGSLFNQDILANYAIFGTALGLVVGIVFAMRMSRNFIETGLIPMGTAGAAILIFLIPFILRP